MKRILSLTLAVLIIVSLFASCGSNTIYYKYDMNKYVTVGEYSTVIDKETSDYTYAVEAFYNQTFDGKLDVKVTEGKVKKGDIANIDYKGLLNAVAFDGGTATGYDLEIGSNSFIEGFEDGLIGAEIGKQIELNLTFPTDYGNTELAGQAVVFEVKVNYVTQKGVPTDENVKRFGFASLEDYEKKMEEYALSLCLFYNIFRKAEFIDHPKKEETLLYNYLLSSYEEACAENNMTLEDLATANSMSLDELYTYLKDYEVKNEMQFYMTAYYVLQENGIEITKEDIEAKRSELTKEYDQPLEDIGYYEINIQQSLAYDMALEALKTKAEAKK